MRLPRFIALGRIADLLAHPDAERIALTSPARLGGEYRVTVYQSRAALEAFCRDGSAHVALVRAPVPGNVLTNRNTQRRAD